MKQIINALLLVTALATTAPANAAQVSSETQATATVAAPGYSTYRDWRDSCGICYRTYYYYDDCGRYTGTRTVRL